jgi:putative ABC transport system permease protein
VSLWRLLAGQFPSLVIARRNISRAKLRSALAAASILVGVVAIGGIGGATSAFEGQVTQNLEQQGASDVRVFPSPESDASALDREDARRLDTVAGGANVVLESSYSGELVTREGSEFVFVLMTHQVKYDIGRGSIPDNWRRAAVVSPRLAERQGIEVGDRIKLRIQRTGADGTAAAETTHRVAAIIESGTFTSRDVYLPPALVADRQFSQIRVTTESADRAESVAGRISERYNDRKDAYLVIELSSIIRLLQRITGLVNTLLTGLAAISLVVSAVSIANTMLMATIRRREEIGVLRAVGYQRSDVLRVLVVEAALIGIVGSAIGSVLALGITMVANAALLDGPFAFTAQQLAFIGGAAAFGVIVSVLAGFYPSWKAASERPVEALRG